MSQAYGSQPGLQAPFFTLPFLPFLPFCPSVLFDPLIRLPTDRRLLSMRAMGQRLSEGS
jgi:hypothetical protein